MSDLPQYFIRQFFGGLVFVSIGYLATMLSIRYGADRLTMAANAEKYDQTNTTSSFPNQRSKKISHAIFVRRLLTCITIIFVLTAGTVWILSIIGILDSWWSPIMVAVFTILGTLFAFLAAILPLLIIETGRDTSK